MIFSILGFYEGYCSFFWCYHSKEIPFLIDMSVPGLIKIPQVSRAAFPGTLESCCHPGPSFLVARCTSGVPTVQNEQGRKWDIQLTESAARGVFARDEHRFRRERDPQSTNCPRTGTIRPEKVRSAFLIFFFAPPIFQIS